MLDLWILELFAIVCDGQTDGLTDRRTDGQKQRLWLPHGRGHNKYEVGTLAVNGRPRPLLAVLNVTAHPSTASVPITVSLSVDLRF